MTATSIDERSVTLKNVEKLHVDLVAFFICGWGAAHLRAPMTSDRAWTTAKVLGLIDLM
jgi:hypothetical protein